MKVLNHIKSPEQIQSLFLKESGGVYSLVRKIASILRQVTGSDLGCIALVEGDTQPHLVVKDPAYQLLPSGSARWGPQARTLPIGASGLPKRERSFIGYVAFARRPCRSGNVRTERFYLASHAQIESELAVPIVLNRTLLGVINLESMKPHFYTAGDQKFLEHVARQIGPSLDSLMIREGLRTPFPNVLDRIRSLLDAVPVGIPLYKCDVLNRVSTVVANALYSRSCTIWLLDRDRRALVLRGAYGRHRRFVNRHRDSDSPTLGWRAVTQRCLLSYGPNYRRDRRSGRYDKTLYGRRLTSPLVAAPLLSQGQAIGVIKVGLRRRTRENTQGCYTPADEAMLQVLQGHIAASLELRRLETERREAALKRSGELSHLLRIFGELDLDQALNEAAKRVPDLCNGRHCSIFLLDETSGCYVLRATRGLAREKIGKACYLPGEGLTGWVAEQGRSLRLDDRSPAYLGSIDPNLKRKEKHKEGSFSRGLTRRPFLAVPIFVAGKSIGVIRVSDRESGCFEELDEHMLTLVADHISSLITNSRVFHDQLLNRIRRLQEFPITSLATLDAGIDAFARSAMVEAAKAAAEVLQADNLTLYEFLPEKKKFKTPPIWKGDIWHPEFMSGRVYEDDAVWKVLLGGSRYREYARRGLRSQGMIPARDGLPPRERFVIREGIVSSAGVRMEIGNKWVGVLFVNFRSRQRFDLGKRKIIEGLASQLALCLEIATLSSRQQADYFAQELHDAVLHTLGSKVVGLASAAKERLRRGECENAMKDVEKLEQAAQYCLEECQGIRGLLMDPIVEKFGLVGALYHLRDLTHHTGLELNLPPDDGLLPLRLKIHLYRIVQALLANVEKHAKASRVTIRLAASARAVRLDVDDDGVGFDQDALAQRDRGYGLRGIQERVRGLGGSFTIKTSPDAGTALFINIPLEEGAYDQETDRKASN